MKKILSFITIICLIMVITTTSFASSLSNYYTTSTTGWTFRNTNHEHRGTKSTTYAFYTYLMKASYGDYMENAVKNWSGFVTMNCINLSDNPQVEIKYEIPDFEADFVDTVIITVSSGHITKAKIQVNKALMATQTPNQKQSLLTAAIGNIYGLGFTTTANTIMGRDATRQYPTNKEFNGINVTTHTHVHSGTLYGTFSYYSSTKHKFSCSNCLSYSYLDHVFVIQGGVYKCLSCGYIQVE